MLVANSCGIVILRKKNHLYSILVGSGMGKREAELIQVGLWQILSSTEYWGDSGPRFTPSISLFSPPVPGRGVSGHRGSLKPCGVTDPHGSLEATCWDSGLCIKTISRAL